MNQRKDMQYREARMTDLEQLVEVRLSVKENVLSDPALITAFDYEDYLTRRGKGWVAEVKDLIVGFAVADLEDHNIWALFIRPQWEGRGIGMALHRIMLDWYFNQTKERVWLSTAPGSRAERFYRKAGWTEAGRTRTGEVKFEMTASDWSRMADEGRFPVHGS